VSITASDVTSGVAFYQVSESAVFAGATWQAWTGSPQSAAFTLSGGDGGKTVYARVRDAAGNESGSSSDTITLDEDVPAVSGVSINGGAAATNNTSVTVSITAGDGAGSGVSQYQVSESATFVGATWQAWTGSPQSAGITLTGGDGEKTVYARVRDNVLRESSSSSDTITLDTAGPTFVSVTLNGDYSVATVSFDDNAFANSNGTGDLQKADFNLAEDSASADIGNSDWSVSHAAGATTMTISITWTGTPVIGTDKVTVTLAASGDVYDEMGNPMSAGSSVTGKKLYFSLPPHLAAPAVAAKASSWTWPVIAPVPGLPGDPAELGLGRDPAAARPAQAAPRTLPAPASAQNAVYSYFRQPLVGARGETPVPQPTSAAERAPAARAASPARDAGTPLTASSAEAPVMLVSLADTASISGLALREARSEEGVHLRRWLPAALALGAMLMLLGGFLAFRARRPYLSPHEGKRGAAGDQDPQERGPVH
jgi:hypothetical protein